MPTYHWPEDLECYRIGREFRKMVARFCRKLPREEEFRLKDQMLRAARSVTNNIAEGFGRHHDKENIQFCRISRGSLMEMRDHLFTAVDEDFCDQDEIVDIMTKLEEALKSLNGYMSYLKRR